MKLLVCDVEGTIFKTEYQLPGTDFSSTIWQMLAFSLGEEAINDELITHFKWAKGEYKNYIEWMKDTINIHIKYGLIEETFNNIIKSATYNPGVREFFNQLDRSEYIPVLISGGFQNLSERAQKDLNISHSFTACNYFFENGKLRGYNLLPSDFQGKYNFLKILLKEYGLSAKDWIFIGDGKNDVKIAKKAKLSIGFNPHLALKKVVNYSIRDFMEIKSILLEDNKNVEQR